MADKPLDQLPVLFIIRPGATPACLVYGGIICRGCPGWRAMHAAIASAGAWPGSTTFSPQ